MDYLEQLWAEAIDLPEKNKVKYRFKGYDELEEVKSGPFKDVYPALCRLPNQREFSLDMEWLAAYVRHQACFGVLVALDDPGLGKGRIAGIHNAFLRSDPKSKGSDSRGRFIKYLWDSEILLQDDARWLKDVRPKDLSARPFNKLYPAIKRLLKQVKTTRDIGRFLSWNSYLACAEALRLLEQAGYKTGEEPVGLHEMMETSFPAEGRKTAKPELKPVLEIRSAQSIAFSPDSKTLAVASASSPVRLVDLQTGKERLSCQGIRVHIYNIVFSPDGKRVTAAQQERELSVCDAKKGKLLHKLKRTDDEVSGLAHTPGDQILCSAWCGKIAVFDAKSGKALPPLQVCDDEGMVDAMTLFQDGTRLAVLWNRTVGIWSWPDRKKLLEIKNVGGMWCKDIAVSPHGRLMAVADEEKGARLFDTLNGKGLGTVEVPGLYKGLAFSPDGRYLVLNVSKSDHLCIWDLKESQVIRKLPMKSALSVEVSPDGAFLAANTDRVALVWRWKSLLGQ